MCYPKPGPRCSASAAARYARAKHAAYAYFEEHREHLDFDEFAKLEHARNEAEHEYAITPAGIKALERTLRQHPDSEFNQMKLAAAISERTERIAAVQSKDIGDHHPNIKNIPDPTIPTYTHTTLAKNGDTLTELGQYDPDVQTLLNESETWVSQLTADEIETLHWYSMGGYAEINGGLSNPNFERSAMQNGSKQAAPPETIALLDSALAKADHTKTAIVYRRHFFYTEDGKFGHLSDAQMQEQFKPGTTYTPGFYMSTSLNPRNISMGAGGFMACLQIKTHRGASIAAAAQQGTAETEILLPRDATYKIISNNCKVSINSRGNTSQIWIIQLEELPA